MYFKVLLETCNRYFRYCEIAIDVSIHQNQQQSNCLDFKFPKLLSNHREGVFGHDPGENQFQQTLPLIIFLSMGMC